MADKFYTKVHVAQECFERVVPFLHHDDIIIEPSAGNGSFIPSIQKFGRGIFLDIEPENPSITQCDFLTYDGPLNSVVVGNPPFGRQSSLAKRFIHKACSFARLVAFILPKSFKKDSMNSCFDSYFHCIHQYDIPKNSFLIPGGAESYDVPCVFQIWVKRSYPREIYATVIPPWMTFVRKSEPHTCSFRRVGVRAGEVDVDTSQKSEQTHYFIHFDDLKDVHILSAIQWRHDNTVGPRSISKREIIVEMLRLKNG